MCCLYIVHGILGTREKKHRLRDFCMFVWVGGFLLVCFGGFVVIFFVTSSFLNGAAS